MKVRLSGALLPLLLLAIVCSGCTGTGGYGTAEGIDEGTPGAAVVTFFDHLNSGDLDAARNIYTIEARLVVEDPEIFQGWADLITQDGTIDSVSIVSSTVIEQTAAVEFEIVFGDGSSKAHTVDCLNQEGEWRLGPVL
jgi:hypothetical protein